MSEERFRLADYADAIREVLDAYDQILSSDASTVKAALRSAAK